MNAAPSSAEFRVNQAVRGMQKLGLGVEAVGIDAAGGFVVAYTGTNGAAGQKTDIFAQRFAADGTPEGREIAVNQNTRGSQHLASIAVQRNGRFVVVWAGEGAGDAAGVFFRRFAADGAPLGAAQRVNFTTKGIQTQPAIAMDADGQFIVVWAGQGRGDRWGVFYRRYNAQARPRAQRAG